MAREFRDLAALAAHFVELKLAEVIALEEGLKVAVSAIEETARGELGTYQPEVGPFQDWAELADSTKEDRLRQGYTENDPLLRSGELGDRFSHEVVGLEGAAGSPDDKMVWLEFGTEKMPPRPVWGPAAFRNHGKILRIIGAAAVTGLLSGSGIHPSLGYDL